MSDKPVEPMSAPEEGGQSMSAKTFGVKLKAKKGGSLSNDLLVGHLTNIGEIGAETDEIEVTTHDSPNGYREFEAGLKDAGEVAVAGILKDESIMVSMMELQDSAEVLEWEVEYPSGSTWAFSAFVKSMKDGPKEIEGVATFEAALRLSGKPTFTKQAG